ncbi:MAG TPA: hypothetical protein VFV10_03605, partial [Gammaproteobacteria bacterium]|nr:hypothetical protein [Gammaproteobacteria bacterium]
MNPLKRLRKYRRAVAGALLPVVAFVWIGAAASPCIGAMGAAADPHDGVSTSAIAAPSAHHSASTDAGAASAAMHAVVSAATPGATDGHGSPPSRSSSHCPHCPPGDPHTGSH